MYENHAWTGPAESILRIRTRARHLRSLAPLLLSGLAWSSTAAGSPVIFSVTADVPYNAAEIPLLEQHVADHNTYSPSSFLVHLGDINQASEGCHEERYRRMGEILRRSEVAAFIVPGDNEWIDCTDPDQGWSWWEEHLGGLHDEFCFAASIEAQDVRPENFAFVQDDVLFVGLNRPAGVPADVTADDADWVDDQFDAHGDEVRAVVLMAHAEPDRELETAVRTNAGAFAGPVLYLHGNGHGWQDQMGWLGQSNLHRVQVDMGALAPPVQVTVTDGGLFLFDRDPWPAGTPPIVRGECAETETDPNAPVGRALGVRVASDDDDAEQSVSTGAMSTSSSDLELGADNGRAQLVGLRFRNLSVPRGATILSATLKFVVDEGSTGAAPLRVRGQASDDAAPFSNAAYDVSARPTTSSAASWSPSDWTSVGTEQQTPDLAAVVQEIVSRPGWAPGNDLAFVISGTGRRTAESYRGSANAAPRLDLVYADPIANASGEVSLVVGVAAPSDDAEQSLATGAVDLNSTDLELVADRSRAQLVGLRFANLAIPAGATILGATMQFTADETDDTGTALTIRGQASDDAPAFTTRDDDLGARPTTAASAGWSPTGWTGVGEAGPVQRTSDLSAILQEIVDRPGWSAGQAAVMLVSGSGVRVADAFDGSVPNAPTLVVRYLP